MFNSRKRGPGSKSQVRLLRVLKMFPEREAGFLFANIFSKVCGEDRQNPVDGSGWKLARILDAISRHFPGETGEAKGGTGIGRTLQRIPMLNRIGDLGEGDKERIGFPLKRALLEILNTPLSALLIIIRSFEWTST